VPVGRELSTARPHDLRCTSAAHPLHMHCIFAALVAERQGKFRQNSADKTLGLGPLSDCAISLTSSLVSVRGIYWKLSDIEMIGCADSLPHSHQTGNPKFILAAAAYAQYLGLSHRGSSILCGHIASWWMEFRDVPDVRLYGAHLVPTVFLLDLAP
jgi:hypothetical protein